MTNTTAHPDLIAYFEAKIGAAFPGHTGRAVAVELAEGVAALGFEPRNETLTEAATEAAHVYGATADAEFQAEQSSRYLTKLAEGSRQPALFAALSGEDVGDDLISVNEIGDGQLCYRRADNGDLLVGHYGDDENQPGVITGVGRVDIRVVDVTAGRLDEARARR